LIRKPQLVLADEPTGSLDVQTGEQIMKLIHALQASEGFILVLVTHDPQHAAQCRERYVLRDGKLQRMNETDALLSPGH
jgi:putative ABC transport system ATP-binding protein